MNPFPDYPALASSFCSFIAGVECVKGWGFFFSSSSAKSICPQLLSPPKSLCCTHLSCTRHVGAGTLQPLTFSSSTPFQGLSSLGHRSLFSLPSPPVVDSSQFKPGAWGGTEVGTRRLNSWRCGSGWAA